MLHPLFPLLSLVLLASAPAPAPHGDGGALPAPAPAPRPGPQAVAPGQVFLTPDEALKLAFPKCEIERTRVFLTKAQEAEFKKLGKVELESRIVFPYVAKRGGKVVGTAWFDTHRVRSLKETVMFVVDPEHKIERVELLAFGEPTEYIPRAKWYAQFLGKGLGDGIDLRKKIQGVTGATLTATATTNAARRALALQAVVFPKKKSGAPGASGAAGR